MSGKRHDESFDLIMEEVESIRESKRSNELEILNDFTLCEIVESLEENESELKSLWSEIQCCLLDETGNKTEEEIVFKCMLRSSDNIELCNRFLMKKEYVELLINIRNKKQLEEKVLLNNYHFRTEEEVKDVISEQKILSLAQHYMKLPDNYRVYRNIKCPFLWHKDETWSFHIYPHTNSCYCFWCRRWGWPVQFLSYVKWISNKEAFKELFFKE